MTEPGSQPAALSGYRVLEVGDELGHYCGKLLADLGAEVIKVEPLEGVASRRRGPFAGGESHPEKSLRFLYFNANKQSVTLDLEQEAGKKDFRTLVRSADALVESLPAGYLGNLGLDYTNLSQLNPALVMVSVTAFGQSGPNKNYKATDLVSYAMSGTMAIIGEPPKPPLVPPGEMINHFVSAHAAQALLTALYHRQRSGQGQYVDVSAHEVLAQGGHYVDQYSALHQIPGRAGEGEAGRRGVLPAKDGYVNIVLMQLSRDHWDDLRRWMGDPEALRDPAWYDRHYRSANADVLNAIVADFTREKSKEELYEGGQAHSILMGPYDTPGEFLVDPHLVAREYFIEADHPIVGKHRVPGAPYLLSATPWASTRLAPLLGEHNRLFLGQTAQPKSRKVSTQGASALPSQGALHGIRVLDFSWALVGPFVTRFLGEQGAQIIKVESSAHYQQRGTRPGGDPIAARQQRSSFADLNRNKLDITLNMGKPEARALAKELAKQCDVVVENFSPHVLKGWGLDYPALRAVKPDIIVASLSGHGATGPHRDYLGNANTVAALVGFTHLWNYLGAKLPTATDPFLTDYAGGIHGAVAIMAALVHRDRTGQGQFIDQAQTEAVASLLGPIYMDVLLNEANPQPTGNARDDAAPHGCFRCKGEDSWCAIAVTTEEEWQALRQVLGNPAWTQDPKFAATAGRVAHREELERLLEEWTSQRTPYQVMGLLQEAGVPAGAVQNLEDIHRDPQLRERGFLTVVDHPGIGPIEHPGPPFRFSKTPTVLAPYPLMGEYNHEVFCGLLGLSEAGFERQVQEGIIV